MSSIREFMLMLSALCFCAGVLTNVIMVAWLVIEGNRKSTRAKSAAPAASTAEGNARPDRPVSMLPMAAGERT